MERKIVVSFTTIPSRIAFIEPVIQSLLAQSCKVDEIHIQVPRLSLKEQCEYTIPNFIDRYKNVYIKHQTLDFGSACKWLYPLQYLQDEGEKTYLIITDDDFILEADAVKTLLDAYEKNQRDCICFIGGQLPSAGEVSGFTMGPAVVDKHLTIITDNTTNIDVDTVQGFGSFILNPHWFKNFNFSVFSAQNDLRIFSDDILLSGALESLNINRIQLGPYRAPEVLPQADINPIHGDGRLRDMTLNTIIFLQDKLGIWPHLNVVFPPEPSRLQRIKSRVKRLIKRCLIPLLGK